VVPKRYCRGELEEIPGDTHKYSAREDGITLSKATLELVVYDLASIASRSDEQLQFTPDIQASYTKVTAFVEQPGIDIISPRRTEGKDFFGPCEIQILFDFILQRDSEVERQILVLCQLVIQSFSF
jgi:hypothetical protein